MTGFTLSLGLVAVAVLASLAFAVDIAWSYLGQRGRYAVLGVAALSIAAAGVLAAIR